MKDGITIFKWASPIICLLIAYFILRDLGCGRRDDNGSSKVDTISVIKTVTIDKIDTHVIYKPHPYKVEVTKEIPVYIEGDPVIKYLPLDSFPPLVRAWVSDYHSKKYYDTTISIKDSIGNTASVTVTDSLYKNSIFGRKISLSAETRTITNTITLDKPRVKGYAGLEVMGNTSTPISYTGISFSLLLKNQNMIGVKGGLMKKGNELYGVEYKHLIRLRK